MMIEVRSIVGAGTGLPLVHIKMGSEEVMAECYDARALALNILCAAEAATHDKFLFEFLKTSAQLDEGTAYSVLAEFRNSRAGQDFVPGSYDIPEDGNDLRG